jgi:hypothetical protein
MSGWRALTMEAEARSPVGLEGSNVHGASLFSYPSRTCTTTPASKSDSEGAPATNRRLRWAMRSKGALGRGCAWGIRAGGIGTCVVALVSREPSTARRFR